MTQEVHFNSEDFAEKDQPEDTISEFSSPGVDDEKVQCKYCLRDKGKSIFYKKERLTAHVKRLHRADYGTDFMTPMEKEKETEIKHRQVLFEEIQQVTNENPEIIPKIKPEMKTDELIQVHDEVISKKEELITETLLKENKSMIMLGFYKLIQLAETLLPQRITRNDKLISFQGYTENLAKQNETIEPLVLKTIGTNSALQKVLKASPQIKLSIICASVGAETISINNSAYQKAKHEK